MTGFPAEGRAGEQLDTKEESYILCLFEGLKCFFWIEKACVSSLFPRRARAGVSKDEGSSPPLMIYSVFLIGK
jgi:hypothetical protein